MEILHPIFSTITFALFTKTLKLLCINQIVCQTHSHIAVSHVIKDVTIQANNNQKDLKKFHIVETIDLKLSISILVNVF